MFERFKSLLARKGAATVAEPSGETILFNAYCTRTTIPKPGFAHRLIARRDLSDPQLLVHLNEFCGYIFGRGDSQMTRDKYHVIGHVQRVRQQVSLDVGVADLPALHAWAKEANAILFTPDGHVTDDQGRILVHAASGQCDPAAQVPYCAQALARKAATEAALSARGIAFLDALPPVVCEDELSLRERDSVVERARALLLVALRAESVASGDPMSTEMLLAKMPLADDGLSPKERAFIEQAAPSVQECAPFVWRYECLNVIEWALGLTAELPFPSAPCDAARVVATLIEMRGPALRTPGEILDALDLHYRLNWHIRQSRLKRKGEAAGIDADVVSERHHALNWLVRFQNAPWDEVDTPT